jgi:hypothetical protein
MASRGVAEVDTGMSGAEPALSETLEWPVATTHSAGIAPGAIPSPDGAVSSDAGAASPHGAVTIDGAVPSDRTARPE